MGDALSPGIEESILEEINSDLKGTGPLAIALTGLLAFGFLAEITRFRYWRKNLFLQLLLKIAKSPIVHWIGQFQAFVLNVPYYNELYLVWGVLLMAGFSSFYSIIEHTIYTTNKKKLMPVNEGILLANNFGVFALLLYYTLWYTKVGSDAVDEISGIVAPAPSDSEPWAGRGHFALSLWGIASISLIKNLYQIFSYYYADHSYGSANTKWVSFYMKRPANVQNFDPKKMTGYSYVLLEKKHDLKVGPPPNYEIDIKDEDLVTIQHVWLSEGWLLKSSGGPDPDNKLKDLCLSFALFKMLKRRFVEQCETAEANRPETRIFIRQGLLESSPKRVLSVIDKELRFLQDLFYTKYPTVFGVFGFGFPVYTLLFGILFTCFFGIYFKLTNYNPPEWDIQNYTNNGLVDNDVIVTKCILSIFLILEVYEFTHYFFSDWSKVLLVCKYVKSQILDHLLINKVLWVFCSIYIPRQACYQIGQYSLLECSSFRCRAKLNFFGYRNGVKKVKYVRSKKVKIMEAILPTLKQFLDTGLNSPATITALSRPGIKGELPPWVCELQNPIQMILIWHVATNFCWMDQKKAKRQRKEKIMEPVAVNLSNYCAYLVAYAPELLPINSYICTLMFERIVHETRDFFRDVSKKRMVEAMEKVGDNEETVIGRGAQLGKTLKNVIKVDEALWNFLKEVWAEMLLRLAPSETSVEHAMKMAEGGEFMTYLWVLLYHAGFLNQSSFKDSTTSMV